MRKLDRLPPRVDLRIWQSDTGDWFVRCLACGAVSPPQDSVEECGELWIVHQKTVCESPEACLMWRRSPAY